MAQQTSELQLIVFDYVIAKLEETNELWNQAMQNAEFLEDFVVVFDEVAMKRDELLANYFALCAVPPKPESRPIQVIKDTFANFEKVFRQLRVQYNRCTIKVSDLGLTSRGPGTSTRPVLPPLPLPVFSGNRAEWSSFSELFKSMVHQDTSLSDVQKLHYLLGCLKGEPKETVSNLPITMENYNVVWSILEKRYKNLRVTATLHVQNILHLPRVSSNSPESLSRFISGVRENLNALSAENFPVSEWSFLLLNILLEKIDSTLRQEFELSVDQDLPTCECLLMFLERYSVANENVQLVSHHNYVGTRGSTFAKNKFSAPSMKGTPKHIHSKSASLVAIESEAKCPLCKEKHQLSKCDQFLSKSVHDRVKYVKEHSMCFNCLRPNHSAQHCLSKFTCRQCNRRHHSLLHFAHDSPRDQTVVTESARLEVSSQESATPKVQTLHLSNENERRTTILLSTALVQVRDGSGQFQIVRALLDCASQISFITERCVQQLGLQRHREKVDLAGVGQTPVSGSRGVTYCCIKPTGCQDMHFDVRATILKEITHPMPSSKITLSTMNHLQDLKLADPSFNVPGPIDMLLAADIVSDGMTGRKIEGEPNAFHTVFGWIVSGRVACEDGKSPSVSFLIRENTLDLQLQRFWEIEELPTIQMFSADERKCEEHYNTTHTRDPDGRYVLRLPFKQERPKLGESLQHARLRYEHLERKLSKNPELASAYNQFLKEYEELGHMTRISSVQPTDGDQKNSCPDPLKSPEVKYVIPHHAVIKDTSSTTKLRVVFDGSAVTSNGISLNDVLHSGQKLQKDICDIIGNFRTHRVVFTADICKMYRQIRVHPDDCRYQCILWRPSAQDDVQLYTLNTVTYGLASSPYQALRTLMQLASDESQDFPLAAQSLLRDVFVDDVVTGANSLEEAMKLKFELVSLLQRGGFELRKWSSNSTTLLENVPVHQREVLKNLDQDGCPSVKVLGIHWCPETDEFTYHVNVPQLSLTKRGILSTIARLYDPCGWVSPVVVWGKILLQMLWTLGLDWDQPVPIDIGQQWLHFKETLGVLAEVRIPRHIDWDNAKSVEFHGFCDASEKAYAAVVYVRIVQKTGVVSIYLITSKSKVAPLKTLSIPRLELSGALLLARLWQWVSKMFNDKIQPLTVYMWSDSSTVLSWLRSSPHKFKPFVANRVSEIQLVVPPSTWRYVPSGCNPADVASRGAFPDELVSSTVWFYGPDWLKSSPDTWPANKFHTPDLADTSECKRQGALVGAVQECDGILLTLLKGFSSLSKLKRVTAWILRARAAFKKQVHSELRWLSAEELKAALMFWIRFVQQEFFSEDLQLLSRNECSKKLRKLHPFLDPLGVIRVGGRLQHSALPEGTKHPILLPGKCHLSLLIVRHCHEEYLHAGPQAVQALIQRQFWIFSARQIIRRCVHRCVKCFRWSAKAPTPLMGDLPAVRFSQVRPFLKIGVDFAGPFSTRQTKARKAPVDKSYLCIFVCMSTKAVHLEAVSSLCTEAFLAALKRFVSVRGTPSDICSDQGTNFIGASRHLNEVHRALFTEPSWQNMQTHLTDLNIVWHFNPPAAPHFGGLWEAAVKSAKLHMKRVIGDQILTFEEITTLFTEISAVLNSRPLCPLSSDPSEFDVLTPGHFLVGAPLVGLPEQDLSHVVGNRLDRWQLVTKLKQSIWKRWSSEYLHTLHQRTKWSDPVPNLKIDTVVLIRDSNLPPLRWKVARVVKLHPGKDGVVRVVSVRTLNGELVRPVSKLCLLPVHDDS